MKNLKSSVATCVLTLSLAITALGGDMPGPGFTQTPPSSTSSTSQLATSEPVHESECVGGSVCNSTDAGANTINEATIIAIWLLSSVW